MEHVHAFSGRGAMLIATACLVVVCHPVVLLAQQSTLKQQLLAPDCSVQQCEMKPPTITAIQKNKNRPVITGTYDAAFTKQLRITFGQRVYILDVDEELVSIADEWQLNLLTLPQPLVAGVYELIVETEGYDGEIKRDSVITTISKQENDGMEKKPIRILSSNRPSDVAAESGIKQDHEQPHTDKSDASPQPMPQDEVRSRVSLIPFIAVVGTVVVIGGAGVVVSRRNSKN